MIFEQSAIDFISDVGYDPLFGARPIKRAIQTYVENPFAKELLTGKYTENSTVKVSHENGENGLSFWKV